MYVDFSKDFHFSTVTSLHVLFFIAVGMSNAAITFYTELQNMLSSTSTQTISFSGSRDSDIKKYRFDLQKAINITINSISANSGEVLIDKITKLRRLLGGQSVNVMGKAVDTSRHPQAKLYCCNLLAQKLVASQRSCADLLISYYFDVLETRRGSSVVKYGGSFSHGCCGNSIVVQLL